MRCCVLTSCPLHDYTVAAFHLAATGMRRASCSTSLATSTS